MKTILISAALLAPLATPALAADRITCMMEGQVFKTAASYRDQGMSPTQALAAVSGYERIQSGSVTPEFVKKAINLVYFDGGFAAAGGDALSQQMAEACMYPNGRYQPLQ